VKNEVDNSIITARK